MAKVEALRLEVPEVPQRPTDYRVLKFVKGIFVANGCLGEEGLPSSFFQYGYGSRDSGAKQRNTTHYLVSGAGRQVLIFASSAERMSRAEFEDCQEREVRSSQGYSSLASAGQEAYRISSLTEAEGLQEPELLIGATYPHEFGSSTGISRQDRTSVHGRLLRDAAVELGLDGFSTNEQQIECNALAIGKLLELL